MFFPTHNAKWAAFSVLSFRSSFVYMYIYIHLYIYINIYIHLYIHIYILIFYLLDSVPAMFSCFRVFILCLKKQDCRWFSRKQKMNDILLINQSKSDRQIIVKISLLKRAILKVKLISKQYLTYEFESLECFFSCYVKTKSVTQSTKRYNCWKFVSVSP